MPNKKTLAHSNKFHFYHKWLDEYQVHLELGEVYKRGSYRYIIPIPIHIWEVIHKIDLLDCSLIDVKINVDKQIKHERNRPFFNRITRFYQDELDDNNVYLASEHANLGGKYRSSIAISIDIWETIRKINLPNLSLIDKSDEELLAEVQRYKVNGDIGYEQDPPLSAEMIENLKYMEDKFRPEQIRLALEEYKALRIKQQLKEAKINSSE